MKALLVVAGVVLAFVAGVVALEAWIVMALWNWVAVALFGAPVISFGLAFGLMLLISMLTGGIKKFLVIILKKGIDNLAPL